jgi:hypothetical protein
MPTKTDKGTQHHGQGTTQPLPQQTHNPEINLNILQKCASIIAAKTTPER